MAIEPQLVDYIKKARASGQTDDQSRGLLYKNGWTVAEVDEAITSLSQPQTQTQQEAKPQPQQAKPQPQYQPAQTQQTQQPQQSQQPKAQPQVQSQPKAQQDNQPKSQLAQNNMPRMRGSSHVLSKILGTLIVLIIVVAVGYLAGAKYINPNLPYSDVLWSLMGPNPKTILDNMLTKMKDVKTYGTNAQILVSDNKGFSVLINLSGTSDTTDIQNPKADISYSVSVKKSISENPIFIADMNMLSLDKAIYLKLNNISSLDNNTASDINKFVGKWFRADEQSAQVLAQSSGNSEIGAINSMGKTNGSELNKQIENILATKNLLTIDKRLGDENINGKDTYHYLTKIKKDDLASVLNKEAEAFQSQYSLGGGSLSLNMIKAFITSITDAIGDIEMEVWIGKKDYMLYKFYLDKTIDLNKIVEIIDQQINIKLTINNSNFGQPVSVKAPETYQKVEDVIVPLIKINNIKSNFSAIGFMAQSIYNQNESYSTLCNSGLLNGYQADYGETLVNIHKAVVAEGGQKPRCLSGLQDFCVSTELQDGTWVCVDKNGVVGTTKCISFKTVCQ